MQKLTKAESNLLSALKRLDKCIDICAREAGMERPEDGHWSAFHFDSKVDVTAATETDREVLNIFMGKYNATFRRHGSVWKMS